MIHESLFPRLFPVMGHVKYSNAFEKESPAMVEELLRLANSCLKSNLSYLLEPQFRDVLQATLTHWAREEISYDEAFLAIRTAIETRPRLASLVVPSYGISQLLRSFGFFSLALKSSKPAARSLPSLRGRVAFWSRAIKGAGPSFLSQRRLVRTIGDDSLPRFEPGTLEIFCSPLPARHPFDKPSSASRVLIVGPSHRARSVSTEGFEEILLLVTPSFDVTELSELTTSLGAGWFINGVFAEALVNSQQTDLLELAAHASKIYCNPLWVAPLRARLGSRVFSYESGYMDMWTFGSPNLLHRAVGVALSRELRAHVTGANLYVANRLYDQKSSEGKPSRQLHPFFTCASYAEHNPVINFLNLRRLYKAGWVSGDQHFEPLMKLSTNDYLIELDASLGRRRL